MLEKEMLLMSDFIINRKNVTIDRKLKKQPDPVLPWFLFIRESRPKYFQLTSKFLIIIRISQV
jgi:hypothetical protein